MSRAALFGRRGVGALALIALLMVATLIVIPTPRAAAGSTCGDTYTLSSGTGDWSVATNWSTGSLPTSSQIACWGANVTMIVTTSNYTVPAIQGGALQVSGGTLDITNSSVNSSVSNLSVSSGALQGPSPLAVTGTFAYSGGALGSGSPVAITQSGGGAFTISGTNQAYFEGGSIQTSSNVSISNTNFIATNSPQLTTTGTVTFAPATYSANGGVGMTIAAKGFVTTGTTVLNNYGLTLNPGGTSSLAGNLSTPELTVASGATLPVPSGVTLTTTGGSTISGTITGAGSYAAAGYTTTVTSGATLATHNVDVSSGSLIISAGATYAVGSGAGQGTTVSGGTLEIDATGATTGDVTLSSGTLYGSGSLAMNGNFTASDGALGSGSLPLSITQSGGGTFTINGTNQVYFEGGSIQTSSNVSITNTNLIATNSPQLTTTGTVAFGPGTYSPNGGVSLTIAADGFATTGTTVLNNYGLTLNPGGTSSLAANLSTPELTVASGATLPIPSGVTLTTYSGAISGTITGAGTFSVAGSNTNSTSSAAFRVNNVDLTGGTLTVVAGATYAVGSGTGQGTTLSSGALVLNASGATTGDLTINGGQLGGTGTLGVSGAVSLTSGSTANSIAVTQTGNHSFSAPGSAGFYFYGGSFQTSSNVSITDVNFIGANNPSITTTGTVTFAPGSYSPNGGPDVTISAAGFVISGNTTLPNEILNQSAGVTTVTAGETFAPGEFTLAGGTLQVDGTLGTGPTVSGGMLYGTGTVSATVNNTGGVVAPGDGPIGVLTVGGFTQTSGGVLEIGDDGPGVAGTNFSQLRLTSGGVSLGGALQIDPSSAYAPAATTGDSIPVITGNSGVSGSFTTVSSTLGLPAGESFTEVNNFTNVDAVVSSAQAPVNASPPILSGNAVQGQQLSVTPGSWNNGPTTETYQWVDCTTAAATSCASISGATSSTYTLQSSDVGSYVTVTVTAHNGSGLTASAQPNPVGPVTGLGPVDSSPPILSGNAVQGQQLSVTPGSWNNGPTTETYQWVDCTTAAATSCMPISGATSSTYTLQSSDVGSYVTVTVTAHNGSGLTASAQPNPVGPVTTPTPVTTPPTDQSPPTVTGTPSPGDTLTCDPGTWTGNPTFTYSWSVGKNPVAGATTNTYVVTVLDEGQPITCTVHAKNSAGSASATSAPEIVPEIGTLDCPKPTGSLTDTHLGPLSLGETQARARATMRRYRVTHGFDYFCQSGGRGLRGAYEDHRFVILLTDNPYYKLRGARVGLPIKDVKGLKLGKEIVIGGNDWYIAQGGKTNWVFKVHGGLIREMGIALKAPTLTTDGQRRFLSRFKAI